MTTEPRFPYWTLAALVTAPWAVALVVHLVLRLL